MLTHLSEFMQLIQVFLLLLRQRLETGGGKGASGVEDDQRETMSGEE